MIPIEWVTFTYVQVMIMYFFMMLSWRIIVIELEGDHGDFKPLEAR